MNPMAESSASSLMPIMGTADPIRYTTVINSEIDTYHR